MFAFAAFDDPPQCAHQAQCEHRACELTTGRGFGERPGRFTGVRPPRDDRPQTVDHEVVRRLRAAGAIVVGLTRVPELCVFGATDSSFGITHNPWDLSRTPGGSSGGSAAAVAGGMVPIALGNDGMGSIRIPAACCGLFGIKPGFGLVPSGVGANAWYDDAFPPSYFLGRSSSSSSPSCSHCGGANFEKLKDILDVWFDSGVSHAAVLRSGDYGLADPYKAHPPVPVMYLEGHDQHRGWFQSSLLTGCAINDRAPYDALLTHGFVVDGNGHKMSKSKGNVIAPQKLFDTLGADILRLWTASTDYSGELTISDEILKRVVESYRRIRNTLRFLLANIADFDAARDAVPVGEWLEIDRYALALTQKLQADLCGDYERYEFHFAVQKLLGFCSEDLGGFYLDILKDRLYTAGENSKARRSAQNALYHITQSLARLIAPILSFTGEEVWATLNGKDDVSVFEQLWYKLPDLGLDGAAVSAWGDIRAVREQVNKKLEEQRAAGAIGSALQAEVDVYAPKATYELLARLGDDLRLVFITSRADVHLREGELEIKVAASGHVKCERCWHYRSDVGSDANHPTLCGRCVSNLFGNGEARRYA